MKYFKSILLLALFALPFTTRAQEVVEPESSYTDQLEEAAENGAFVVVHQDSVLDELVNAGGRDKRDSINAARRRVTQKKVPPGTKVNGYRVQVFMAGNTAQDKATAKNMARRFKGRFPSVNAYVRFNSPHWICTTGDFPTQEEANRLLSRVRAAGFSSACVVRSKVNVVQQPPY